MLRRCIIGFAVVLLVNPAFALDKSLVDRAVAYQAKYIRWAKEQIEVLEAFGKPLKDKRLQEKLNSAISDFGEIAKKSKRPIGDVIKDEVAKLKEQVEAVQKNEVAVLPSFRIAAQHKTPEWGLVPPKWEVEVVQTDGPTEFYSSGTYFVGKDGKPQLAPSRNYFDGWEHDGKNKCLIVGGAYESGTRKDNVYQNRTLPLIKRFDPQELKEAVIAVREATKQIPEAKGDKDKVAPGIAAEPKKPAQEVKATTQKKDE